jgi:hypothetical protein
MKCRNCNRVIRTTFEKYVRHCAPCWERTDWSGARRRWNEGRSAWWVYDAAYLQDEDEEGDDYGNLGTTRIRAKVPVGSR